MPSVVEIHYTIGAPGLYGPFTSNAEAMNWASRKVEEVPNAQRWVLRQVEEPIVDGGIYDLPIPGWVRAPARAAMEKAGIYTLGHISRTPRGKLARLEGVGSKTRRELYQELIRVGLPVPPEF